MAQSGYTPILIYASGTATNVPLAANMTSSASGAELALNYADGKLYYKNSSGVVTLLASSTTVTNSFSAGTTGFTPSTATTGAVTLGGTLITSNGGTGLASYTAGDLSYYASGTALTKLAIGTAGQILTSSGTAPQWSTLSGVAVTTFSAGTTGFTPSSATAGAVTLAGTLATTNGGTGLTSFTSGGVVYASSSSALATGSALTFNGTRLGIGTASPDSLGLLTTEVNGNSLNISRTASTTGRAGWFSQNTAETIRLFSEVYGASATNTGFGLTLAGYGVIQMQGTASNGLIIGTGTDDPLIFGQNNTEGMRLTSTGLGIGTSSPNFEVHISTGSTTSITQPTAGSYGLYVQQNSSGSVGGIYIQDGAANSGYSLVIADNNGAARLSVNTDGYLYLGGISSALANENILTGGQGGGIQLIRNASAAPTSGQSLGSYAWKGSDSANTNASAEAMIEAVAAENFSGVTAATSMLFYTKSSGTGPGSAPTKRATLTSTGTLGVGNFAPYDTWGNSYVALQVQSIARTLAATGAGAGDLTLAFNAVYDSTDSRWEFAGTGDKAGRYSQTGGGSSHIWYVTDTNGTAGNAITFTQAMTLNSSGSLLIGKTSGGGTTKGIQLEGNGTAIFTTDSNAVDPLSYFVNSNASVTNGFRYVSFRAGSGFAEVGTITTNGSSTTAYNTSSDYRLKNTISPMTGALSKVALLKPCTYKWNSDGSDGEGFIAHELAEVVPQCVTGEKDAVDEAGNPRYQGIDTSFLVATLTAAIQEQQAIIESLKARLDAANL